VEGTEVGSLVGLLVETGKVVGGKVSPGGVKLEESSAGGGGAVLSFGSMSV
jgi:hypothetical protein